MADLRPVSPHVAVAPQLTTDDMAAIREAGYVAIINNRPDGEEPGQPAAAEIRAAAQTAGLAYAEIPIGHHGFSQVEIKAMAAMLEACDGPVVAFCRSGTRSCNLWALARATQGDDPAGLVAAAAGAGYDLGGLRPMLEQLAGRA